VLLLGGWDEDGRLSSTVHTVDLATGVCTPQPSILCVRGHRNRRVRLRRRRLEFDHSRGVSLKSKKEDSNSQRRSVEILGCDTVAEEDGFFFNRWFDHTPC
jgi:hypothetical protein